MNDLDPFGVARQISQGGCDIVYRGLDVGGDGALHVSESASSTLGSMPAETTTLDLPPAVTRRLNADIDPFEVGRRSGLLWNRGDFCLAGLGEAARLRVERPDGAASAAATLALLAGDDEVGVAGTGPVAFGAFPFDRTEQGELILPEVVVGRSGDGQRWVTTFGDGTDGAERVTDALSSDPVTVAQPSRFDLRSGLTPEVWRDEVVAVARDRIRAGELTKMVLARELILETDAPVDAGLVLDRLRQSFGSAIVFAVDGFIGASPELLVSRQRDVVRAHPLAGTAPRSSDPAADQHMGAGLLASTKDRTEHRITIDWLLDTLLPFCSYVDAEPEPTLVSLANVHHLGTRVEGRLSSPPASVLELVAALHPTPAVGGDPRDRALAGIAELEQADRGRYAGPTGWVDGAGNGAFAVSVRSAQLDGMTTRLFAGVGVVADSDPEAELAETRAKFQAMLSALIRP